MSADGSAPDLSGNASRVVRSSKAEVRNPILALPGARRLALLPPEARLALAEVLQDIANDARTRAQASWNSHKAPMAMYWKIVAVYSRHIRLALLRSAGQ